MFTAVALWDKRGAPTESACTVVVLHCAGCSNVRILTERDRKMRHRFVLSTMLVMLAAVRAVVVTKGKGNAMVDKNGINVPTKSIEYNRNRRLSARHSVPILQHFLFFISNIFAQIVLKKLIFFFFIRFVHRRRYVAQQFGRRGLELRRNNQMRRKRTERLLVIVVQQFDYHEKTWVV